MCQRQHPHLSLCQKDCSAGAGGDMKEVRIPVRSSVEQIVFDGFDLSTALKCGRTEIYKCRGQTQDTWYLPGVKWNRIFLLAYSRPFVSSFLYFTIGISMCCCFMLIAQWWSYCKRRNIQKLGWRTHKDTKTHIETLSCCTLAPTHPPPHHRFSSFQIISAKSVLIWHHNAAQSEDNPWHFYHSPPFYLVCAPPLPVLFADKICQPMQALADHTSKRSVSPQRVTKCQNNIPLCALGGSLI